MMNRPWLLAGAVVGVAAIGVAASNESNVLGGTPGILAALLATGVLAGLASRRCTHRYATLLPPVRDGNPERDHARWYCDRCGRTWDAGFESTTRPRLIYNGFDEQKAVQAAIRADANDKQRRRLATQRGAGAAAGMNRQRQPKPAPVSRPGPRPLEHKREHMLDQRAVGFRDDARPSVAARRARD